MSCPIAVIPKDRKMTRQEWKALSRALRATWRQYGAQIECAVTDTMIFGTGTVRLDP